MKNLLTFALLLGTALQTFAREELTIAAAADLQPVLNEIAARFETRSGNRVKVAYGSSGNFFAQIQNNAPFDLFFSADVEYPEKLAATGLGEPGSLYRYAIGTIVLWVPKDSKIDVQMGLSVIADSRVKRVSIANPAHAPYGRAAELAIKNAHLWQTVSPKLVWGENISQAAQFVQSGNADAGILALSLVLAPAMRSRGKYFEIPRQLYPSLQQGAVILKSSPHKDLAQQFLDFVKSQEIKSLMRSYGFTIPGEEAQ